MADRYAFAGQFYELLSRAYSGNAIPKCRDKMFDLLKPGDKVIFGGVGYGWDAIRAAQLGADVTIVEMSHTMITKFHKTVKRAGAEGLKLRAIESESCHASLGYNNTDISRQAKDNERPC